MATHNPAIRSAVSPLIILFLASLAGGCSDASNSSLGVPADDTLMNQVQYLGTHNSYHVRAQDDLFAAMLAIASCLRLASSSIRFDERR